MLPAGAKSASAETFNINIRKGPMASPEKEIIEMVGLLANYIPGAARLIIFTARLLGL